MYQKGYFSQLETAEKYIEDLFKEIKTSLPIRQKHFAPPYFDRYGKGMYYAAFRKSKRTQWYVFFNIYNDSGETVYLVRYISNNHMIAKFLRY